jgi:phenylacetate-CoA ligase
MGLNEAVYARLPAPLQDGAVTARGWMNRRHRYGATFREAVDRLMSGQWRTAAEWEALQREGVAAMVDYARRNVPYYANFPVPDPRAPLAEMMAALPLLPKPTLRGDPAAFRSRELDRMRTVTSRTSGTTGAPLVMHHTHEAHAVLWAGMDRFWRAAGVRWGDRRLSFTGNRVVADEAPASFGRTDRANARLLMSVYHLGERTVDRYLDEIERFAPAFVDGYPSALLVCARRLVETGRELRVGACFPTAETLSADDRATLEAGFRTRVYNQYGSAEGASLVTECPAGSLHVNPEVGVVEVLREDGTAAAPGEEGWLVLTSLLNRAMPLIRYRIGDLARAGEPGRCACGREMPRISELSGRQDDVVVTRDGRRIGMLSFNVFKWTTGIAASQIVQESVDHFVLKLVPGEGYDAGQAQVAVNALHERVGADVRVDVQVVDDLPRGANGKLRAVVSKVAPAPAARARAEAAP